MTTDLETELTAIAICQTALENLSDEQRERVFAWVGTWNHQKTRARDYNSQMNSALSQSAPRL